MTVLSSYFSSAIRTVAGTSYRCVAPLVSTALNTASATVSMGKKVLESTASLAQATTSAVSSGVAATSNIVSNMAIVGLDAVHKSASAATSIAKTTLGAGAMSNIASNMAIVGLDAVYKSASAIASYLPTTVQTVAAARTIVAGHVSVMEGSSNVVRKVYNSNIQFITRVATNGFALYAIDKPLRKLNIRKSFMEKPAPATTPEKNFVSTFFSTLLGPFLGEKVSEKILQSQKEAIDEFQIDPNKALAEKEKIYPIIASHLHKLFALPNLKGLVNELLKDYTQVLKAVSTLDMTKDSNAIQQELLQKLGVNPQVSVKQFKKQITEKIRDNLLSFLLREEKFLIEMLPPLLVKNIQSSLLQSLATTLIKALIFLSKGLIKVLVEHSRWLKRVLNSLVPSLLTLISSVPIPDFCTVEPNPNPNPNTNMAQSQQAKSKMQLKISEAEKKKLERVGNACFEITFLYLLDRCVSHLSTIDLAGDEHAMPETRGDLQNNWNAFVKALIPLTNTTIYEVSQHMKIPVWGVNQFVQWTTAHLPIPAVISRYYHPLSVLKWVKIDEAVKTLSIGLQNSLHIDPTHS